MIIKTRADSPGQATQLLTILWPTLAVLVLFGMLTASSLEGAAAYLLICVVALLPAWIWIRDGAQGVPILPAVALMSLQFYGFPFFNDNYDALRYSTSEVLAAAITVALYLLAATIAWRFMGRSRHKRRSVIQFSADVKFLADRESIRICIVGLVIGAMFEVAVVQGWLGWTGSFFGLVRSIAYAAILFTTYLLGVLVAQGKLRRNQRRLAFALLALIVVSTVSSLFLVRGLMLIGTFVFAYFITCQRLPLLLLASLLPLVFLLHAGKADMRNEYWLGDGRVTSVVQLPAMYAQWVDRGLTVIGEGQYGQNIYDRASLANMLLLAQAETPRHIDFLNGETYVFLPQILVPRFFSPDKPVSQAAMNMLNLRYWLVTPDAFGNIRTAIGWGVIAEAYVNFGYKGVALVGMLMGGFMGWIERRAIGKSALSLPSLIAIITMVTLINLEADLTYLSATLIQSYISITLFFLAMRLRWRRQQRRLTVGSFGQTD